MWFKVVKSFANVTYWVMTILLCHNDHWHKAVTGEMLQSAQVLQRNKQQFSGMYWQKQVIKFKFLLYYITVPKERRG